MIGFHLKPPSKEPLVAIISGESEHSFMCKSCLLVSIQAYSIANHTYMYVVMHPVSKATALEFVTCQALCRNYFSIGTMYK